jgi:DNA-directed RNA polymerase subunit K/omega
MSKPSAGNRFEFVVVAGARARQLMRGALPRVADPGKAIVTAQREVREGAVAKVPGTGTEAPQAPGGQGPGPKD